MIGGVDIKGLKFILILLFLTGTMAFAYTVEEVLEGVEKTTFQEYDIPYVQWFNSVEGELRAGYDPFMQKGLVGAQANIKLFENLDLSTSFAFLTDFGTDSSYQFSLGVNYDFLRPSDAEKRYKEAKKEVLKRQLQAVDLFFEYLKKKIMLTENDGDMISSAKEKMERVDMAYLAIKLEAMSSIANGEPQITGLSQYQPEKIDEDIVQTAVIRYLNLFSQSRDNGEQSSFYALFRTDYNTFLQGISGGIGGAYDFQVPVQSTVSDKLEEIEIRKNKLLHNVLTEEMPIIKEEYQRLEQKINRATSKIVSGEMTKEELNEMQKLYVELENQYIEMTLDAVKIEYIFTVLSGLSVR
ncbi:MAG: hypothetical protein U9N62_11375 [Thermotogota bacterium]|nr:hypothetical protein [Thermotogota bacterium]